MPAQSIDSHIAQHCVADEMNTTRYAHNEIYTHIAFVDLTSASVGEAKVEGFTVDFGTDFRLFAELMRAA